MINVPSTIVLRGSKVVEQFIEYNKELEELQLRLIELNDLFRNNSNLIYDKLIMGNHALLRTKLDELNPYTQSQVIEELAIENSKISGEFIEKLFLVEQLENKIENL